MEANKILTADFLDILFEGKNKEYGAYSLRREYDRRVRNATIIMLIFFALLSIGVVAYTIFNKEELMHPKKPVADINLENVDLKNEPPPPPPPPPPPQPPKLMSTIQYTTPVVVKNEVKPEEQPPDMDQIKNQAISTKTLAGDVNGVDPNLVQSGGVVAAAPTNQIYRSVEQMPEFPGGEEALGLYLSNHIRYPAIARENGIQGTVFLQFVVNKDGSITDVKVLNNPAIGGGCEDEAMRVVKNMPKWRPGRQNGQSVPVYYNLPVRFRLDSN
jgi:protein TonB